MRLGFTLADVRELEPAELLAWFDELVRIADEEAKAINRWR